MKPIFSIFTQAIKFDCLFWSFFQLFIDLLVLFLTNHTPPLEYMFQNMLQISLTLFSPFQCKKETVLEVLKTWYFPYSAFSSTG